MNSKVNMYMRMNDENRTINNYNNDENQICNNERYNSLFFGEPTHVLPKSFVRRNFKRYKPNFNPQSPNNYNNSKNNNQYPIKNEEANNAQSNNMI